MKIRLKPVIIGVGMVLLMTLLFIKTNVIDPNVHNGFSQDLHHLIELDATLNKDILELRYGVSTTYDVLTTEVAERKYLQTELRNVPDFLSRDDHETMVRLLDEFGELQNQKEALVESFKSRNAIINNSVRYYPVATSRFIKSAQANHRYERNVEELNYLLRDVLTFYQLSDPELEPVIANRIELLQRDQKEKTSLAGNKELDIAISHARIILKLKPELDQLIKEIVSLPTANKVQELITFYDSSYDQSLHRSDMYRQLLYVLSLFLLGYIVFIILKLKKAKSELERDVQARKRTQAEREVISAINQGIASTANLDELFQLTHRSIKPLIYADNCYVAIYDAKTDLLSLPFCIDKYDTVASPAKLGNGLTAYVLRKGLPMLMTPDVIRELTESGEVEPVGTTSAVWLGVPLRTPQGTIGALVVQHYDDEKAYDVRDVEFLSSVGDQVALAIERKRAESDLRENEEKFRDLVENANDVIYTLDLTGNFTSLNRAGEHLTGYSREEAVKMSLAEVIAPEDVAGVFERFSRNKQGVAQPNFELEISAKDGRKITMDISSRLIVQGGVPVGLQGIGRDITERKRDEVALEESEASFRSLFDTANDAIMVLNEGVFIDCNHRTEILFGGSKEWILGRSPMELSPLIQPDGELSSEKAPSYIGPAMQGVPQFFEWQHSRRDGTLFDTEISLNKVDFRGEIHLQAVVRDITERKRADAELQDSHRRVEDIVNSVEGIVWEADAQTFIFSFVSAQAEQILGYPSQRWIDEPTFWSDHIHPDDRDVAVKFCVDSTNKLLRHEFEYRMRAHDGRDVWIKDTVTVLSENGRPTMLRGIMMDITEQKRTEAALEESEASFKALFDTASDAIFVTKGGAFQACNPAAEKLFGCTREEMLDGRSGADFSPLKQPDGRLSSEKRREYSAAAIIGVPQFFEWTHSRLDGTPFDAEVNLTRVEVGGTTQVQATVRDITERKRVEEETRRLNAEVRMQGERLNTIVANVEGVVWETKTKIEKGEAFLRFDFVSDYIETMLGYTAAECLARPDFWIDLVHPDDRQRTEEIVRAFFAAGKGGAVEFRWITKDGREVWVESRNMIVRDDAGKVVGLRGIAVDITERKSFEEQLTHQALHDPLTKLANRVLFRDRVEHAINRTDRSRTPVSVLFLDLDNFKSVNDSLGHAAGDELLISVTERLQACLRNSDTPARLGGDEFAVLIEDIEHEDEASSIADRIRVVLAAPFFIGGTEVFISASIGVAMRTDEQETPEELIRNADVAMYRSKSNGKDQYTVFENEMHNVLIKRLRLESEMRAAIDAQEFEVYYQPIMDLVSNRIMGMEALVRWNHPEHGLIPPLDFIPVAEETGLIVPLGKWILEEACLQAGAWQTKYGFDGNLTITVNVANRQFLEEGLLETVKQALANSGLPAHCLVLEITESTMLVNTEATISKLKELKNLGIRLAIDDFGTGYSSLSYLQRLPVDILKIDKSFVDKIVAGKEGAAVAKAIIAMGETLHLKTIAEGIETDGQQAELLNLGCELGQGYHFAKPLRTADMNKFLRSFSLLQKEKSLDIPPGLNRVRTESRPVAG